MTNPGTAIPQLHSDGVAYAAHNKWHLHVFESNSTVHHTCRTLPLQPTSNSTQWFVAIKIGIPSVQESRGKRRAQRARRRGEASARAKTIRARGPAAAFASCSPDWQPPGSAPAHRTACSGTFTYAPAAGWRKRGAAFAACQQNPRARFMSRLCHAT